MKHEFVNVHHVSFDLWLTLIKSNPQFKKERNYLFKDFFKLPHSIDFIMSHFKKWDVRFTAINERTGRNLDAEEMLLIILSDLEHETQNIDRNTLEIFFLQQEKLFFENQPELIEEKLSDYLADLTSRGINVSVLSNTGFIKGELLRALLDRFDISKYFKFQLYSDEMSFSKPSGYVFQEVHKGAMGYKKITTNNILHIGDNHYADVIGAKNAGMQSALINSNNVSLLNLNIHT